MYFKKRLSKAIWYAFSDLKKVIFDNEEKFPLSFFDFLPVSKKNKSWKINFKPRKATNIKKFVMDVPFDEIENLDLNKVHNDLIEFFKKFNFNIHILNFHELIIALDSLFPFIKSEFIEYSSKKSSKGEVREIKFNKEKFQQVVLYYYLVYFFGNILLLYSPSYVILKSTVFKTFNIKPFILDILNDLKKNYIIPKRKLESLTQEIRNILVWNLIEHTDYVSNYLLKQIYLNLSFNIHINTEKIEFILIPLNNLTKLAFSSNISQILKNKYWFDGLNQFYKSSIINLNHLIQEDYIDKYESISKQTPKLCSKQDNFDFLLEDFYVFPSRKRKKFRKFNYTLFDYPLLKGGVNEK